MSYWVFTVFPNWDLLFKGEHFQSIIPKDQDDNEVQSCRGCGQSGFRYINSHFAHTLHCFGATELFRLITQNGPMSLANKPWIYSR